MYTSNSRIAASLISLPLLLLPDLIEALDRQGASTARKPTARLTPEMVRVPGGSFTIGSLTGQVDNQPPKKITIARDFAIGRYEVTFDEYDAFATETGRKLPSDEGMGRGKNPVINVSLFDALAYCDWLGKKNNRRYRLPTEAEWEYVAKYSATSHYIPVPIGWGDAACRTCLYPWQSSKIKPVGSYEPNELGIHDLQGNVWEWTCSAYTMDGYNGEETRCHDNIQRHTVSVRGGSWRSDNSLLKVFVRYNNTPHERNDDLGFRILEEL